MNGTGIRVATLALTSAVFASLAVPADAKVDACKLVTPADQRAWFGRELKIFPEFMNLPQSSKCSWGTDRNRHDGFLTVLVVSAHDYEPHQDAPGFTELHGIGSQASFDTDSGFHVTAVKGSNAVSIIMWGATTTKAAAIAALRSVVAKL